eukprot:TRINITY_DN18641_c0_g1_i1.p1 TRINITY_DN18641_c0_g1~~TRINITY_DN18641_c0_g1_i1.p1  ORF type:complete len:160 (-),score=31.98 TRINITY_DN18641_c0_g1_i1:40-519(-)
MMAPAAIVLIMICNAFEVSASDARDEDVEGNLALQREILSTGKVVELNGYLDEDETIATPVQSSALMQNGAPRKMVAEISAREVTVMSDDEEIAGQSFIQSGTTESRISSLSEDLSEDEDIGVHAVSGTALYHTKMASSTRHTPLSEEEALEFEEAFEA